MTALDADQIRRTLIRRSAPYVDRIEVFSRIDSTNTYLKDQPAPPPGQFRIVIADHQTAGRGRHDRSWVSSPGGSLCLSLSYRFSDAPSQLSPLTLALGVGIADSLANIGLEKIQLKWPNDLLIGNAKLGGILTETLFRRADDVTVIAGIGINVAMLPEDDEPELSHWADTATCLDNVMTNPPSREHLSEIVIESLMSTFGVFEAKGFAAFARRFADYDWLAGKSLAIETPEGTVNGIALGIDDDGALLVQTESDVLKIHAGSVTQVSDPDVNP
jgi:BirA family transcriptional regulator, biotin operon repressor / biotin---[acetyl-CoA-carboxylase] ligase